MNNINQKIFSYVRMCVTACLLAMLSAPGFAATATGIGQNLTLNNGVEIPLTTFPNHGKIVMLWLPSEHGLTPPEYNIAAKLGELGVEVWLADLHAAYFLPTLASSMQQIPADDVAQLIGVIARRTGKKIYLVTEGNGAALALTSAAALHNVQHDLRGAILLSPNLYVATPDPGEDVQYLPITMATHLPVAILQPELSPWRWHLDQLQSLLEQGGATVTVKLLPGVRDRFYFRDDALPAERALTPALPQLIFDAYTQLRGTQP